MRATPSRKARSLPRECYEHGDYAVRVSRNTVYVQNVDARAATITSKLVAKLSPNIIARACRWTRRSRRSGFPTSTWDRAPAACSFCSISCGKPAARRCISSATSSTSRACAESFFWPTSHTEVLRVLLKKSQEGTRIVYIPGNHDDDMRALIGTRFGNIEVLGRCIHTTAAGRRLLVLHGDEFDAVMKHGVLSAFVGAFAYRGLLCLNRFVHWLHEVSGRPYWSLAQHVKTKMGQRPALHRDVPPRVAASGRSGRRRRHRLRAHPQGRARGARQRLGLLQRRRLGRELHGARRAAGRRARAADVADATGRRAAGAAAARRRVTASATTSSSLLSRVSARGLKR